MAVSVNAHVKTVENIGDPLITQDGQPIEGVKIKFQLVNFGGTKPTSALDALSGEIISNASTTVTTDANGEFITELWPNSRGDAPTAYYVTFSKGVKPFFILVEETTDTTLLTAKLSYSVGTGAVSLEALSSLLNAYTTLAQYNAYVAEKEVLNTSGEFEITLQGASGATGTAKYVKILNMVTLTIPQIKGISTNPLGLFTSIPINLSSTLTIITGCVVYNNGIAVAGYIVLNGTFVFLSTSPTISPITFGTTGIKGLDGTTISYVI